MICLSVMVLAMLTNKKIDPEHYRLCKLLTLHDICAFIVWVSGGIFAFLLGYEGNEKHIQAFGVSSVIHSCILCILWLLNCTQSTFRICGKISVQDIYAFFEISYFSLITICVISFIDQTLK